MIAMSERCGCGTELRAGLPFCVACGSPRQAPLAAAARGARASDVTSPALNASNSTSITRHPAAARASFDTVHAVAPSRVPTQRAPAPSERAQHPTAAPPVPAARHASAPYGSPAHPAATYPAAAAYPGSPAHPAAAAFPGSPARPAAAAYPGAAYAGPPARSSAPWIVAAAGIVVVAVVAAVLVVVMRPATIDGAAPAAPAAPPVVVTAGAETGTGGTSGTTSSSTGGGTATLQATVDADRSSIESLDGQWVAQLSSKRPGTVDDGTTYDASAIWSHYQALASAHPGALLLWSGDWSVYRESDYWVVVAGQGFSTAAGANAWCSAQGLGADDCFAKRLSHTDGPAGSTVPR